MEGCVLACDRGRAILSLPTTGVDRIEAQEALASRWRMASQNGSVEWTRDGLEVAGFEGFQRLTELSADGVPQAGGVYVVLRPSRDRPQFLMTSGAGHFKNRDPSVPADQLERAWVDGAPVLYIGKASGGVHGGRGLRKRLDEYGRHGRGERAGHWGGRYIWQLGDSADLLVAWKTTPDQDPEEVESALIADHIATFGSRPFANRKVGKAIESPDG